MRRLAYVLPVLFLLAVGALFWFGLNSGPPDQLPSPLIGKSAPNFVLAALDAQSQGFGRSDLTGRPTIINFWASWCPPCRVEHPMLLALASDGRIRLWGVVYKDKADAARGFLDTLGNPFARLAADPTGRVAIDWGVTGAPETFVVDASGIVRAHVSGAITPDIVEKVIFPSLGRR